ncbi:MAG: hypothetical protein ABIA74_01035 [bacterium]
MNKEGFLLIELLVALSLFVSFVFIIAKFQSVSLDNYILATRKLRALNLALESGAENGKTQNHKIYKIDVKKINYGININKIFFYLRNLSGKNFIFNPQEFNAQEITVSFNMIKGKKSDVKIKKSSRSPCPSTRFLLRTAK